MNARIMLAGGGVVKIDGEVVDVSQVKISRHILEPYTRITRFGGQVRWTDYQHVCFGVAVLGVDHPLTPYWILHEAGEALGVGDVNFRLKPTELRAVDEALITAVALHAGFEIPNEADHKVFKNVDLALGNYEAYQLFPRETLVEVTDFYQMDLEEVAARPWEYKMQDAEHARPQWLHQILQYRGAKNL